jgi:hypothetical protein
MGWTSDPIAETVEVSLRAQDKRGVMLFLVEWLPPGAREKVAHVLYGKLDDAGRFSIADRSGKEVRSLAELEQAQPGISTAVFYEPPLAGGHTGGMLFIEEAVYIESRKAMHAALRQVAHNPLMNAATSGVFGPLAIPIRLHLHIPATPNIPRPPRIP